MTYGVPAGAERRSPSHPVLLPTQQRSLLPSGSPAGAEGHPSSLIYTPHFIALHPSCCSCTSPGYLHGLFFALVLDQPPALSEPFSFLPHVPAGCQHLYTKSLFLNVNFVNGPKKFCPLAAIFVQLLGTHLPPTTQMMYGCWTPSHMH